ncbi:methionine ABC transporter permease [Demequina gelatinilytica]|uniref:methionine ABC transporter permease n=1 Tax=Demequina gelatinilytica TaxID=1638980 RepID=UPI0007805759|nr:methionine ABC transporter permease [Demequina gelatinilytica]
MSWIDNLLANPAITEALGPAALETAQMVGIASIATVALGLPLGVAMVVTARGGLAENRAVSAVLSGVIVNITRSIPYAILMLALIPVTKALVGTSIGPIAASVSLTVAAVPFFARLVETSLREVAPGKVDAANAMGSTRRQIVTRVLLPEALPSLIAGVTTTVVTIVGYSAMAGLVGGGGLGRLAYNYGYQRYQPEVMIAVLVVLVLLVQAVQALGDALARRADHR